jgi:hypothetical protein
MMALSHAPSDCSTTGRLECRQPTPKILNVFIWALRNGQVMTCAFGSGGKCSDIVRWVHMTDPP